MAATSHLLKPEGIAVVGELIETFIPTLVKGAFRMTRRYGEFDADPRNIMRATLGHGFQWHRKIEFMPGKFYYLVDTAFDFRQLSAQLAGKFDCIETACSPFELLGA